MTPETRDLLRIDAEIRRARERALSRSYPLVKQAAELLELEEIEPLATHAKKLRQEIGALLALSDEGSTEFVA